MVVRRTGASYQRRRSSTSGPWHLDLRKRWHAMEVMADFKCMSSSPPPGVVEVPTASVRSCELGCVCAAEVVRQASGWIDTATGRKKGVKET